MERQEQKIKRQEQKTRKPGAGAVRTAAERTKTAGTGKRLNWKIGLAAALALLLVIPLLMPAAADSANVRIVLDGKELTFDGSMGAPFIDSSSRTQVPLNAVATAFGAEVSWDGAARKAVVKKDGITVEVPIGQKYITKDGEKIAHDTAAVIIRQRTYLPIAVVLRAFGASVEWENASRTVIIKSEAGNPQPPQGGQTGSQTGTAPADEMRAMWISYLEFADMPKGEQAFKAAVDKMFDGCKSYGMNTVIVQVRPDSDAMYPSDYFPWSKFASGTQGKDPGYDPLAYMVEAAHSRDLEFHAWVNPYRVTGYLMPWNEVSADNPAKKWLQDGTAAGARRVLLQGGFYYYNPSDPEVRRLVCDGVTEIVNNYDVDGIHFDDYFYPSLNNNDPAAWFDKPEYEASGSSMNISDWRRHNINLLMQDVYRAVKAADPTVVFGVSPAGNVSNLRSDTHYFTDIDTWTSESGYIDYIMPQIYWGFERRTASGQLAPYAYENNLKTWIDLTKKGNVKLYIGLNVDNAGKNVSDNNPTSEWLRYQDILKRQVIAGRNTGAVSGYAFFRYGIFEAQNAKQEVANLVTVLK